MDNQKITKDTTILELFKIPGMLQKLIELGIPCVVCPIVGYEQAFLTLEMVAKAYGLDLKRILKELNEAVRYNLDMKIRHLHHATLLLEFGDVGFLFDPFKLNETTINTFPSKLVLFFTHPHFDHFSKEDITKVQQMREIVEVFAPVSMKKEIESLQIPSSRYLDVNNESRYTPGGISVNIKTVPAYNVDKINPETNVAYHPKDANWIGYLLEFDEQLNFELETSFKTETQKVSKLKSIYVAGDTDFIEEMKQLENKVDIAFLPVSGTYVMTAQEAVHAFSVIKPKIAVPIHYGVIVGTKEDAEKFVAEASEL